MHSAFESAHELLAARSRIHVSPVFDSEKQKQYSLVIETILCLKKERFCYNYITFTI